VPGHFKKRFELVEVHIERAAIGCQLSPKVDSVAVLGWHPTAKS
jgi:hypothetical protein